MKKIITLIFSILLLNNSTFAQKTIEEVNYLLDTQPYFGFRIDYKSNFVLPDSVKQKLLIALNGRLTLHLQDSLLTLTSAQKEMFLEQSKQKCKEDSICMDQTYRDIVEEVNRQNNHFFTSQPVSGELVLAAGNWNIKEAIPLLENAIENKRYSQISVLMALAKLGNDSIKQILMEKYTLSHVLKTTLLDTVNNKVHIYDELKQAWTLREGIETAMYLKSKEMLLNILDLMYIKGITGISIGPDNIHIPYVANILWNIEMYNYFRMFPNYDVFENICMDYADTIWDLSIKDRLDKKEEKKLEMLLSTEYRTMIRNEMRKWVIENVNFENMQQ
ncbi:MAG: hypothetical protein LBG28_14410 [Tannerella sp.]|jgi:hypothetical protein|nr:hypothetical protein [Tannerella sp.]